MVRKANWFVTLFVSGYSLFFFFVFFPSLGIAHLDALKSDNPPRPLQQSSLSSEVPTQLQNEQASFVQELQKIGTPKRALYERYFRVLGADGILDAIQTLWPHCHSEAHDLGKVIYSHVQDITEGVRLCDERCHSGCMHGVLMEAIATKGWTESSGFDLDVLRPLVSPLCSTHPLLTKAYSPGDCAHGVGHALTVVATIIFKVLSEDVSSLKMRRRNITAPPVCIWNM